MATETQLAPAAGAGIGKAIAADLLARPGFVRKMADALDNALGATRRTWDAGAKEWVEEPDTRSQLQAFFGCLAHMEGEPIKRIIHQHNGDGKAPDVLAALRESPALRAAMRRELDKAEFRTRNVKQATPAEADAVEV